MNTNVVPESCPVCTTPVQRLGRGWWRCPHNSSHYWIWRDQQNGHAIRNFLTRPHGNKVGPFYQFSCGAVPGKTEQPEKPEKEGVMAQSVTQANGKTIFELARDVVAARSTCFPDETVTIFENASLRIYISRYQMLIVMTAVNADPTKAERIVIGYLSPESGWIFNLDHSRYRRWAARAKRLARSGKTANNRKA